MAHIHPSAIVDPRADLAAGVTVGPFTTIGGGVKIGEGTQIGAHVVIDGNTRIGSNNRIFSFTALGTEPQDKKYAGEDTELVIGDGNTIREFCLVNTGTVQGGNSTRIGSDNWIMGYVHVAHDCVIGSHTIIANAVQLAGHVQVDDWALLGGTTAVHQFVRIGAHSMVGGASVLLLDVAPFLMCSGHPAKTYGVHIEGLKRRKFSDEVIASLRRAYKVIYRDNLPLAEAREALEVLIREEPAPSAAPLRVLAEFLAVPGRGLLR